MTAKSLPQRGSFEGFTEELFGNLPPLLAAYALAMCVEQIRQILPFRSRRHQPTPHENMIGIVSEWKEALLAKEDTPVGGELYEQLGITGQRDLLYIVVATLSAFAIRYRAGELPIPRRFMYAFEEAFEHAAVIYGVDPTAVLEVAWPVHETRVYQAALALDSPPGEVYTIFWTNIVDPLGLDAEMRRATRDAILVMVPGHLSSGFMVAYDNLYPS